MLKDLSRIHNREQQESWSSSAKKRRKRKVEKETVTTRGGDTLELSHPAQYLAFFKNIDFKHRPDNDLLFFELIASGDLNTMTIKGEINIHSLIWKISWIIKSEASVIEDNELMEIIYNSFNSLKKGSAGKDFNTILLEKESKELLYDNSNELTEILKEFLAFIQKLLPLSPSLKGETYNKRKHFEGADECLPWPHSFNRTKVISINLNWID